MTNHPNRSAVFTTESQVRRAANISELGTYMDDDAGWFFLIAAPGCWNNRTPVIAVSRSLDALRNRLNSRLAIYRGFAIPGQQMYIDIMTNPAIIRSRVA